MIQDNRVRTKICGITRVEDALAAAHAGADAIGLVFYPPSSRHVTLEQAQRLIRDLPPFVSITGLFVDEPPETVYKVMDKVPLDILQFHGNETPDYCMQFRRRYIKAIHMHDKADLVAAGKDYHHASAILVDTFDPDKVGGTGRTFDWERLPTGIDCPLILAGGLNPDNIQTAIRTVHPWGVDVSGGVECVDDDGKRQGGIKSPAAINAFMAGVASA